MKDYTFNDEDAKRFILNYSIKEDKLIINMASGEEYVIPYTEYNEEKVIEIMESQPYDYLDEQRCTNKYTQHETINCILTFLIFLSNGYSNESVLSYLIAGISLIPSGLNVLDLIKIFRNVNDIRKHIKFIENAKILNRYIKMNKNILSGVSAKTREIIEQTPGDKDALTINSMDGISSYDLDIILENIERDQIFGFKYNTEENKKLKLNRKK